MLKHPEQGTRDVVPRIVLVGEVNPYGTNPKHALYPYPREASGNRLRLIVGLTDLEYLAAFERVNLCSERWDQKLAIAAADRLFGQHVGIFVLLGAKVLAAFNRVVELRSCDRSSPMEFFKRQNFGWGSHRILVPLPHPSGKCRAWNEADAVDRVRALMREVAPWIHWGHLSAEISYASTPSGT